MSLKWMQIMIGWTYELLHIWLLHNFWSLIKLVSLELIEVWKCHCGHKTVKSVYIHIVLFAVLKLNSIYYCIWLIRNLILIRQCWSRKEVLSLILHKDLSSKFQMLHTSDQFSISCIAKNNVRPPNFNKEQLDVLMDWLDSHVDRPYPTKAELLSMSQVTGLAKKQVHLWCTNVRRVSQQFELCRDDCASDQSKMDQGCFERSLI